MLPRAPWLTCIVLLPLALTACEPSSANPSPKLVVAVTATSAEPLPALTQDLRSHLHEVGLASEQVGGATVAALVGADREQLPREPQVVDLTPLRGTKVERVPERREEAVTQVVEELAEQLGEQTSQADGLDLLALLSQAGAQNVTDIVVVSSGVSTVNPLDVRKLGWNQSVRSVVDDLDERRLLPRNLEGKNVTFVGLGSTAGTQPRIAGPEQDWVEQLWLSICRRAGAECHLASAVPPASEPVATRPVPEVPVPVYDTSTGTETRPDGTCRTLRRLSGDFLFNGDSAQLRPGATPALEEVVREVRSGARITEVAGHTADAGPGDGVLLSQQRALAVVERLVELGIDRSQIENVVGYGDSRPVARNYDPDGSFNEELAAKNRRVEITTVHTQCEHTEKDGETND